MGWEGSAECRVVYKNQEKKLNIDSIDTVESRPFFLIRKKLMILIY